MNHTIREMEREDERKKVSGWHCLLEEEEEEEEERGGCLNS